MRISSSNRTRLVITMGDPSGVGPEVTVKALALLGRSYAANCAVVGNRWVLDRVKSKIRERINFPVVDLPNIPPRNFSYGTSRPCFGRASVEYIDRALELIDKGMAGGLVTAPVNKASINASGTHFQGHTEYLALKTGTGKYAMMFVGKTLKITLVTRHIALKAVSASLSKRAIYDAIALTHSVLQNFFKIANPRIGVAGLNPHAGEGGLFGDEEVRYVAPAVRAASVKFGPISGPFAPDVIFHDALNKKFDAVVALYHDQALIPFKTLHFTDGVNMTLGLPFVRTSPDHGTAFDIAGKFIADASSMVEAIRLAWHLSAKK